MEGSGISGSVMNGLRWSILTKVCSQIITWGATLFILRSLNPVELGVATLSGVVTQYAVLMSEMGLSSGLIQRRISDRETLRKALGAAMSWSLLICAALNLFAPTFGKILGESSIASLIRLSSLQFLVIPFGVISQASLLMRAKYKEVSLAGMFSNFVGSAATLILALGGLGAKAIVIGSIALVSARVVALNYFQWSVQLPSFRWRGLSKLFGTSGLLLLDRTIWYLQSSVDTAIIGRVLGAQSLGPYSLAMQVASIPTDRAAEAISLVALPTFSKIQDQPKRLAEAYMRALRISAAISFPIFWGLAAVSTDLVRLAFGPQWQGAIPLLSVICSVMPLRVLAPIGPPAITALGKARLILWITGAGTVLVASCVYFFSTRLGLLGAAVGWSVGYALQFLVSAYITCIALSIPIRRFFSSLMSPILFAGVMFVLVSLIMRQAQNLIPVMRIIASVALGALIYVACMFAMKREMYDEAVRAVRDFISPSATRN